MVTAVNEDASRVMDQIRAKEQALVEALRTRTADLLSEAKAWHQVTQRFDYCTVISPI